MGEGHGVVRRARLTIVLAAAASIGWGAVIVPRPSPAAPEELPKPTSATGYVGSSACRGCHPGEHASFSRTYHRTMTQPANDRTVLAPFERRGEEVWAEGKRVVMTTGSHRQQAYWVAGEREGELRLLPFVWLAREKELVPRIEAFLTPPDTDVSRSRWSSSCIACHAVAGEPRHDPVRDAFDTRVAELGIACEACHGPGGQHVERHRDPFERLAQRRSDKPDPTIVHPAKLDKERATAVCGQCHSYAFPRDEEEWWTSGYARSFRAGDPLEPSRMLLTPGFSGATIETSEDALFWPDGTIRVGGRETNGMILSACFTKGSMTCLSCHSMHDGDPRGQLASDRRGDAACVKCHADTKDHARHAAGSEGSSCIACHMPKTSYALLSAVRSHRIEMPRADPAKPNACNLCHLDRSEAWTARQLGTSEEGLSDLPYGAWAALAGDAAVRVVVADALGREGSPAPAAFRAQLPRILADDPYAAIRFVARRSPLSEATAAGAGPLDEELVRKLLASRDTRPVTIAE